MNSKLLRSTTFLCFFLALSSSLFAQVITGVVIDAKNNEPLAGTNITQIGTSNGIAADENGEFSLTLLTGKSSLIKVTFVGYQTQTIDVHAEDTPLTISMKRQNIISNEVFVKALRVNESSPMAYQNVDRAEIKQKNLGQDIPYLLDDTPSVTTTSDAGAGIGYTGLRIRGVDQRRINVTINGIPVNDAESHGVFWVNMPDLASSVENIQIQRGVGTSTNGAAAFGATMNIQTSQMRPKAYGEVNTSIGSYNTRKVNVLLGSGLMKDGWQFEGRLSKINSDGYVDRAFSDLKSFYLSAAKHGDRSLLRADIFSGKEQTYQSWYGISESRLKADRRYNPAGTEKEGDPYDNQTDNYQQDHYQLHYSYKFTDRWDANASLHYTYGRGYYQEYKADQKLSEYSINPIQIKDTTISKSDLIRDRWLDNHFYGVVFSTQYQKGSQYSLTAGGGYNQYDGDHFGEVQWARFAGDSEIDERYYKNNAFKTDFNTYLKGQYSITTKLSAFADAQIRRITYNFLGKDVRSVSGGRQDTVNVRQSDVLTFFNPKAGFTYNISDKQRAFVSLSVGNKEPTRDDYVDSSPQSRPQSETLYDWEVGYKGAFEWFNAGVNFYYMDYKDQLILTGEINDVGAYIRQNVANSYRAGIELQAGVQLLPGLDWKGNATVSRNKIEEYTYYLDNYDTGGQASEVYDDTDIAFSPDFIAHSSFTYSQSRFTAEFSTKYVSRQYLDNTQTHSRSLDPYLVNDLRLGYNWTSAPVFEGIEAQLQINNIFDELYESNGFTFGSISSGERTFSNYYYPQAGRNFLMQLSFNF